MKVSNKNACSWYYYTQAMQSREYIKNKLRSKKMNEKRQNIIVDRRDDYLKIIQKLCRSEIEIFLYSVMY